MGVASHSARLAEARGAAAGRSVRRRGHAGGAADGGRTGALARGFPRPMGRGQLHDPARAGEVPDARLRPARRRQRAHRAHRSDGPAARTAGPAHRGGRRDSARGLAALPLSDRRGPVHSGARRGRTPSPPSRRCAPTSRAPSCITPTSRRWTARATRASFSARDGRPLAGPPTRPLPRIVLEQRGGDLVATGVEGVMETRQQGATLFSAVLVLIALLVVIQLWLVAAAVDALIVAADRRARADGGRLGRAVRAERRAAVVRRGVRRAPAPLGPAWLTARAGRSSSYEPEVTRSLVARFQVAHLADAVSGASRLGALHVPERLRHDRAARGGRDDLAHAVRLPVARPDRLPVLLHAARAGRQPSSHDLRARDRHRVRIRRALAVRPAPRAAGDGHRRHGCARRRRRAVAGVDRRADDSAAKPRTRPPERRRSSSRSGS